MTENQAREKWCPFVRLAHDNAPTGGNRRIEDKTADVRCIASDCMAWRWDMQTNREAAKDGKLSDFGFCGLAGKP